MPGRALLSVEWLLIQDASSSFELSRPLLPGQEFPGPGTAARHRRGPGRGL